jgi:hypothetical protein
MSLKGLDLTGLDMTQVRKCAGHPNGRDRGDVTPAQSRSSLGLFAEKGCATSAPYGCNKGYCWQVCQDSNPPGQWGRPWCWLALHDGYGEWIKCGDYHECARYISTPPKLCGKGCAPKKRSCGCGC